MKIALIPVTPFQQNCSILVDEASGRAAVVDPGGDLDRVMAALGETGATLEKIFNFQENDGDFHWPDLDIDIELEALQHPERFPLKFRR